MPPNKPLLSRNQPVPSTRQALRDHVLRHYGLDISDPGLYYVPCVPPSEVVRIEQPSEVVRIEPPSEVKMPSENVQSEVQVMKPLAPGCLPLEERVPTASVGSVDHVDHEQVPPGLEPCRPCAWYWRPQGCLNLEECRHCHMCPKSALKASQARRKAVRNMTNHVRGQEASPGHVAAASSTDTRMLEAWAVNNQALVDNDKVFPSPDLEGVICL